MPGFPASRDPLALANATLFLPTRRACRLARDVFLDVLDTDAAVLPRILPIGDVDEDELVFAEAATGPLALSALELPPALRPLERRLLLTQPGAAMGGRAGRARRRRRAARRPIRRPPRSRSPTTWRA